MFSIGSFQAVLGIDTGNYTRGILSVQGLTQAFGTTFSTFIANPIAGSITLFANLGRSLTSASDKMLSMAEATLLLSQRTGVSTDTIQALRLKLEEAGVAASGADASLAFFAKTLGEAQSGSKAQADALAALGVSLRGIEGTDDALAKVLDALDAIEDPALKAARAADLFGRFGGAEMVAALGGGSGALAAFRDEMLDIGAAIDNKTLQSLGRLDDEIDALKRIGTGVGTNALAQFLAGIAGDADTSTKSIAELIRTINSELGPAAKDFGAGIRDALPDIREAAKLLADIGRALSFVTSPGDTNNAASRFVADRLFSETVGVKDTIDSKFIKDAIAAQHARGAAERSRGRSRR